MAIDVEDPAGVQQAVEDRCGDDRGAEALLPIAEAIVGSDDVECFSLR